MTVPILRSIAQNLHPVGSLALTNLMLNPDFEYPDFSAWTDNSSNVTVTIVSSESYSGTKSAKLVFTSGQEVGFGQSAANSFGQIYTASVYLNIPVALSTDLAIHAYPYDSYDNPVLDSQGNPVVLGQTSILKAATPTTGWVRVSASFTAPLTTASMITNFVETVGNSAGETIYVDACQLEPNPLASTFVSGDFSGYCWSGTPGYSTTLKTEFPSALAFFANRPLDSMMAAGASMFAPQYVKLVD